jgi:UDP-3-O-[3-hydroxymyristoyl] N-acetylglucosamine deacetylase
VVSASTANVVSTNRSTSLSTRDVRVDTVEHLLSALYSCDVSDAEVLFLGNELPIADGSSLPFVRLIEEAGLSELPGELENLQIDREIAVSDGRGSVLTAVPSDHFWVTAIVDYSDCPAIGLSAANYAGERYAEFVAPARTYGFHNELEALKAAGLGKGASFDNVVALERDGSPDSRTPLRMNDELVRHKILDLIGDLSLTQKKLKIGVVALRPSHSMNVKLSNALLGPGERLGVL